METLSVGTYYPEKWAQAHRGDVITYKSRFPRTLSIGTAIEVHRLDEGRLSEKIATGHVVGINTAQWPAEYEVRVNYIH